ncbi:MAG: T9SS type A sorting domain-containing protein [Bacteroidetes bacterium]|nr:T9SS type A sorting domain-containing protein [Bacteroidota bacterium]
MKKLLYTLSILLLTTNCFSQTMSGTYLIGKNAPTYKTVMSAVNALKTKGVSGPVVFRIYSGTYDEKIIIPQISGASATNRITFTSYNNDSSSVILINSNKTSAENFIVQLYGADFITFYKVSFSSPGTLYNHRCLVLENGAHHAHVLNCKFSGASNWTGGKDLIYSPNTNDSCMEIRNNYFILGSYAITLLGIDQFTPETGHIISDNYFKHQYGGAIFGKYISNTLISNNIINPDNSGDFFSGIDVHFYSDNIQIHSNIITELYNPHTTNGCRAIYAVGATLSSKVLIYNNYVKGKCTGIYCDSDSARIYNNTVIVNGGLNNSCISLRYSKPNIYNNILINNSNATNSFVYIHEYSSLISKYDNNNIKGNAIAKVGTTTYSTLSAWQTYSNQDANSLSRNVKFLADSMHIQDTMMHFGNPLSEVVVDIDGEARDLNKPYVGCDEYYMNILPDDTVFCASRTVSIDAGSGFQSYAWSTGPTSRIITFDSSGYGFGTHKIGITVTYGSFTYSDTIQFKFIDAVANAGIDKYVCTGNFVTLSGSGGVSYIWEGVFNKKSITFPAMTTKDYQLIVTDKYSCSDTDTVSVFVMDYPVINLANDTTFCKGGSATYVAGTDTSCSYVWKSLPAPDTISTSAVFVADTTGRFRIIVTNPHGCVTKATANVTVLPRPPKPQITSSGQTKFCEGDSIQLIAPSGYPDYLWTNGSHNSDIYVSQSSINRLQVLDANTCVSPFSDTFIVTVYTNPPKPIITLFGNNEFCMGDTVTLEAPIDYEHYNWSNGDSNLKQLISKSGLFSLTVIDSNTCESEMSDTVVIVVFPNPAKPTITASGTLTFCERDSVVLTAPNGYTSYVWSDANGDEERTISQNGSFSLHVIDSNMCQSSESDITKVTVKPLPPKPAILITGIDSLESSTLADGYNWYLNDTLLSLTTQLIIAPKSGNFSLITELDGCLSDESDGLYYVRSGLNEQIENSILVYPNPSDGMFYIELVDYSDAIIQIYSSKGQLIRELHITQTKTQINLSNQSKGVYWMKVIGENGIYHVPLVRL